jgi:hypothetical protein
MAICGDGSQRKTNVIRHPESLHCRKNLRWPLPEQVVPTAKLWSPVARLRIRCSISRAAAKAASFGLNGDCPRAISSALMNSAIPNFRGTTNCAAVVVPAPLGPPKTTGSILPIPRGKERRLDRRALPEARRPRRSPPRLGRCCRCADPKRDSRAGVAAHWRRPLDPMLVLEHTPETIAARGAHMCSGCVEMMMTDGR